MPPLLFDLRPQRPNLAHVVIRDVREDAAEADGDRRDHAAFPALFFLRSAQRSFIILEIRARAVGDMWRRR